MVVIQKTHCLRCVLAALAIPLLVSCGAQPDVGPPPTTTPYPTEVNSPTTVAQPDPSGLQNDYPAIVAVVGKAKKCTLYRLDADSYWTSGVAPVPHIRGYEIVQSADVPADQVEGVVKEFSASLSNDSSLRAGCFRPHHALRLTTDDGTVYDVVVCYSCWVVKVYTGDKFVGYSAVTPDSKPIFDQVPEK